MPKTIQRKAKRGAASAAASKKASPPTNGRRAASAKSATAATAQEWRPPAGSGAFVWHELFTPDAAGARAFYAGLFGWSATDVPLGESGQMQTMLNRGQDGIACLTPNGSAAGGSRPAMATPAWLAYVQVADVDHTASRITALGGTITTLPTDIPGGHGRYAVARDPQGAVFAIYAMPATQPGKS